MSLQSSASPSPVKLIALSVGLVVVAAIPVGGALLIAGPTAALALYLGIVVATTAVPTLPMRQQWLAAGWMTVVALAGALLGPQLVPLAVAVVLCCLAQVVFLRMDAKALAVSPAILIYFANSVPAESAVLVALSTLIGAAFLIVLAALAKLPPHPRRLPWSTAIAHALLIATGCTLLLVAASMVGVTHSHWASLAFCLAFVPGSTSARSAVRYAVATAIGATAAVLLVLPGQTWLVVMAAAVGAVLVVAGTLASRPDLSVASVAGTVILLGSLSAGESSVALDLGIERAGSALLAVGLGLVLLLVAAPLERRLGRLFTHVSRRSGRDDSKGSASWTR